LGQVSPRGDAQREQNFLPGLFSVPQLEQITRRSVAESRARDEPDHASDSIESTLAGRSAQLEALGTFVELENAPHRSTLLGPAISPWFCPCSTGWSGGLRSCRTGQRGSAIRATSSGLGPRAAAPSLFEQRVYLKIKGRGYRVRPQVPAYGYRIDLVVTGGENRLAVECDGDEWHGAEQFEKDLARQQDLERVGWRFVRIRESEFYLDPEAALRSLWLKLGEVGIRPFGEPAEAAPAAGVVPVDSSGIEAVVEALLDPFEEPAEAEGPGEQPTPPLSPRPVPLQVPTLAPTPRPVAPGAPAEAGTVPAYRAWTGSDAGDPREAQQGELTAILLDVVAAEGPVLARRAYRLMLQAAGFHRLVHTVVSPLNKAAVRAEREGHLIAVPSGIGSSLVDRVLRLPDQPQVAVRKRGARDLDEIPPSEVQAVGRQLRGSTVNASDRHLQRAILTFYDRTSLTAAASTYIDKCLRVTAPLGPEPVQQRPIWGTPTAPAAGKTPPARPIEPGTKPTVTPPRPAGPEFKKVLAETIARAQVLSAGARHRLATAWLDEGADLSRAKVISAAGAAGAPREWSTVARIVSSTLADWPAAARGAVVDAAFALSAGGVPDEAADLLIPWTAAFRPGNPAAPAPRDEPSGTRCPHGHVMGQCPLIVCRGHSLGGMALDEN
jgi:very-short-patch-repair endonuclease